ncbi:MAG: hypothetical protein WBA17_06345 [Saprospiraceae bacterium]
MVVVTYRTKAGAETAAVAIIKDVYTRKGVEYLQLSTGETIRLDRLVRVGEEERPGAAGCAIVEKKQDNGQMD